VLWRIAFFRNLVVFPVIIATVMSAIWLLEQTRWQPWVALGARILFWIAVVQMLRRRFQPSQ
jgi:hypothetical protein